LGGEGGSAKPSRVWYDFPFKQDVVRFQDEKQLAGTLPGMYLAISTIPGTL